MDLHLTGHVALVTGSSDGVGAQIATSLAAEGCRVLVHGRRRDAATHLAEQIIERGGEADVVLGDLSVAEVRAAVTDAAQRRGVDILVANVGPFRESTWDDVDAAEWSETFEANVGATAALISALLPMLRDRGWGRVITIGSRATATPLPNMVDYSAAKAAVVNMTLGLASHLAGTGVTANCVSPGVILTPSLQAMFENRGDGRPWSEMEGEVTTDYAPNPTGRLGRPADIAAAVSFLASPRADYVNATELRVDGGIRVAS